MEGWDTQGLEEIVGGKRRLRAKRRRGLSQGRIWTAVAVAAALVGLGAGGYFWLSRPTGMAALPDPAVVAPGGFRTGITGPNTITVGLEVRNVTEVDLTVLGASITPPPGLTQVALTVLLPGPGNEGFALEGELPASRPITLGTEATSRNAVVAARFTVNCAALPKANAVNGEAIFVTIKVGDEQRKEELTPPVVGEQSWLTATAQRMCHDPAPTGPAQSPPPPLPPLPG